MKILLVRTLYQTVNEFLQDSSYSSQTSSWPPPAQLQLYGCGKLIEVVLSEAHHFTSEAKAIDVSS